MHTFPLAGVALLATSVAGWSVTPSARAAPMLDQSYTRYNDYRAFSGNGFRTAETFTVGLAGTLSEVNVFYFASLGDSLIGFNILSTAGGIPTTAVVAKGTPLSQSNGVAAFTVSLPVSVGEVLAIEPIASDPNDIAWKANRPGTYAGGGDFALNPMLGSSFRSTGLADDFQTFVTVPGATGPEPAPVPEVASLALFGSGLLSLGMARSRRKLG